MIFADINQRLSDVNASVDDIRAVMPEGFRELKLSTNYRNTYEIAQVAREFYVGGIESGVPDLPSRHGPIPTVQNSSAPEAINAIVRYAENHADETIGVVVRWDEDRARYMEALRKRLPDRVQTYTYKERNQVAFDRPMVTVLCVKSVKGLEFNAVFIDASYNEEMSVFHMMELYVASSRARDSLTFFDIDGKYRWTSRMERVTKRISNRPARRVSAF